MVGILSCFHSIPNRRVESWALWVVLVTVLLPFPDRVIADTQTPVSDNAIEFSARLVWKTGGRIARAQLFVKNDRYRIEPFGGFRTELGYAGVTIVRLDEQKIWYVLSQRRMIVSVPLTSDFLLPFSVHLSGELRRSMIGESLVGDQPAVLYEVEVQNKLGQIERFFEWVDPQREILLKLLSQDRDWFVEYRHVVLSAQPDYYFEAPLGYRTIEAQESPIPRG